MAQGPGRCCPLTYRTSPAGLAGPAALEADAVYVVGGLYGNTRALDAILAAARREAHAYGCAPRLVFNGDFNWFNADDAGFERINREVFRHGAILGNVERELVDPHPGAGCGCAYPDFVDDATVECSNRIVARLQEIASRQHGIVQRLAGLAYQMRVEVGGIGVGVVHGDPDSIAGWGLGLDAMSDPGTPAPHLERWFRGGDVRILACTHTCVAFAQTFTVDGLRRMVINNGAAGMPNFRGDPRVLITRVGVRPSPAAALYGCRIDGVHCDALALDWDRAAWMKTFERLWPRGSAAWRSYRHRILRGPDHSIEDADRLMRNDAVGG